MTIRVTRFYQYIDNPANDKKKWMTVDPHDLATLVAAFDAWAGSKPPEELRSYFMVMQKYRDKLERERYIAVEEVN